MCRLPAQCLIRRRRRRWPARRWCLLSFHAIANLFLRRTYTVWLNWADQIKRNLLTWSRPRAPLIFFSSLKENKRINVHSPVRRILIMRWSTRVRGVYLFRLWPAPSPSDRPSDRASDRNDLSGVRVSLVRYTAAQQVPFFFLFSFFGPTFYDDRKKNKMDTRDLFFFVSFRPNRRRWRPRSVKHGNFLRPSVPLRRIPLSLTLLLLLLLLDALATGCISTNVIMFSQFR